MWETGDLLVIPPDRLFSFSLVLFHVGSLSSSLCYCRMLSTRASLRYFRAIRDGNLLLMTLLEPPLVLRTFRAWRHS